MRYGNLKKPHTNEESREGSHRRKDVNLRDTKSSLSNEKKNSRNSASASDIRGTCSVTNSAGNMSSIFHIHGEPKRNIRGEQAQNGLYCSSYSTFRQGSSGHNISEDILGVLQHNDEESNSRSTNIQRQTLQHQGSNQRDTSSLLLGNDRTRKKQPKEIRMMYSQSAKANLLRRKSADRNNSAFVDRNVKDHVRFIRQSFDKVYSKILEDSLSISKMETGHKMQSDKNILQHFIYDASCLFPRWNIRTKNMLQDCLRIDNTTMELSKFPKRNIVLVYWNLVRRDKKSKDTSSSPDRVPKQASETDEMSSSDDSLSTKSSAPSIARPSTAAFEKCTTDGGCPAYERETDSDAMPCHAAQGKYVCEPHEAKECKKCLVTDSDSSTSSYDSDGSCYPDQCDGRTECEACQGKKQPESEPESDVPCARPDCPGRESMEDLDATGKRECAPDPGGEKCQEKFWMKCMVCAPPTATSAATTPASSTYTCAPVPGKDICDETSPHVCDKCGAETSNKLFDNDAVCRPKPGSDICDPDASTYCLQCVQMIKPGFHSGPQSEKIRCYESYKRECVVCAAAKSGKKLPLNVPICTPNMTRTHHSMAGIAVVCEECLTEAMKSLSSDEETICWPLEGKSTCDISKEVCKVCPVSTKPPVEGSTVSPAEDDAVSPGTIGATGDVCFGKNAKLCEECQKEMQMTDGPKSRLQTQPMDSSKSLTSCEPLIGEERCDLETAKLCEMCISSPSRNIHPAESSKSVPPIQTTRSKLPSETAMECSPESDTLICDECPAKRSQQMPVMEQYSSSCGPSDGQERCDLERAKECELCLTVSSKNIPPAEPIKCSSTVGQPVCEPNAPVCEECKRNMSYHVPAEESYISCTPQPGQTICEPGEAICEECKESRIQQSTPKLESTSCSPIDGLDRCAEESAKHCEKCLSHVSKKVPEIPSSKSIPPEESFIRCTPIAGQGICDPDTAICEECKSKRSQKMPSTTAAPVESSTRVRPVEPVTKCPQPGQSICELGARAKSQQMPTETQTSGPKIENNSCSPVNGMDRCAEDSAKHCEKCLTASNNVAAPVESVIRCVPPAGKPICEPETAVCTECSAKRRQKVPSTTVPPVESGKNEPHSESVIKCSPKPGQAICDADVAVCTKCKKKDIPVEPKLSCSPMGDGGHCAEESMKQCGKCSPSPAPKTESTTKDEKCVPPRSGSYCASAIASLCGCAFKTMKPPPSKEPPPSPPPPKVVPSEPSTVKCNALPGEKYCAPEQAEVCQLCKDKLQKKVSHQSCSAGEGSDACEQKYAQICGVCLEKRQTEAPPSKAPSPIPSSHSAKHAPQRCVPKHPDKCKCSTMGETANKGKDPSPYTPALGEGYATN